MSTYRKKGIYNICIVFAIILSSCFGVTANMDTDYTEKALFNQYCQDSPILNLNKLVSAGKLQQSTIEAVLSGHFKSHKKNVVFSWNGILISITEPALFLIFLSFLSLCCLIFNCSHRCIVLYIHNIDGQKA